MIETNVICDRCHKKCEGTTYYTVDIYAYDLDKTKPGTSSETASQNITTNMNKVLFGDRHFCSKCIHEFKSILKNTTEE